MQGSGRTELIETVFGLRKKTGGSVLVNGEEKNIRTPKQALENGMGLVTEDRKGNGIFSLMSVQNNICVIHDEQIKNSLGLLSPHKCEKLAGAYSKRLSVKTASLRRKITTLSGGNQQKVLIARVLSIQPDIIIMDEPTRGIDVGAKAEIFEILRKLREEEGKSIIIISSELEEIQAECDRILVMFRGKLQAELRDGEITKNNILDAAFGTDAHRAAQ